MARSSLKVGIDWDLVETQRTEQCSLLNEDTYFLCGASKLMYFSPTENALIWRDYYPKGALNAFGVLDAMYGQFLINCLSFFKKNRATLVS